MKTILITLFLCASTLSAFSQNNAVVNGDFEKGNTGWTLIPYESEPLTATIATSNGVDNSSSAKLGVANKTLRAYIEQTVILEKGKDYTFSAVMYYSAVPSKETEATVSLLNATNRAEYISRSVPSSMVKSGNGGIPLKDIEKYTFTFDFTAEEASLILSFSNNDIDKLIRFDNVVIAKKASVGIKNVSANSVKISQDGNDLKIAGANLGKLAIYSVLGTLVRVVDMTSVNEAIVDNLPKGVYVVANQKVCIR